MGPAFWLRWSWRDLRDRWLLVVVIGLTIALGTGAYAGLGSTSSWARETYDHNYDALAMYDLRVRLSDGSFAPSGSLIEAARRALGDDASGVEERLIVPIQVDASTESQTILVPGQLIGVGLADGGPHINRLWVGEGRDLDPHDAGEPTALLELHFARHYGLPASGRIVLSGGAEVRYVGHAMTPEYFMVVTEEGAVLAERNFAAVFTSIETARELGDRADAVNDAVLSLGADVDVRGAQAALEAELDRSLEAGSTVLTADDDEVRSTLYDDIESDAVFFRVFATLLLVGAAFGAFNLTGRIIEAQRREIGVAMALGTSTAKIAFRPLLVSAQIAVLGVLMGVGVGNLIGEGMRGVYDSMVPLPVWLTPFRPEIYAGAAGLGFIVPFAASLYPIIRAVRVPPIEAIRTGLTAAHATAGRVRRIPAPGGVIARMPLRNVQRTPRRTILTALGIGAAVAVLTSTAGVVDTMTATIDRGEDALLTASADRLTVQLEGFMPASQALAAVGAVPEVGRAETGLRVAATAETGSATIDLSLELIDMDGGLWVPAIDGATGEIANEAGIVLSEKALRDLAVAPGGQITVEHPLRIGETAFSTTRSTLTVVGSHSIPMRFTAFGDLALAERMNLADVANTVSVVPANGSSVDDVERALFRTPGVASVQPDDALVDVFRGVVEEYVGILAIAEVVAVALAVAIAFNSASISFDERVREHATMFAFGTPVSRVVGLVVAELTIIGVLATALGLVLGRLLMQWLLDSVLPTTFPEFGFVLTLAPTTIIAAVAAGVVAVGLAPILGAPRLARMDVPAALRLVE
ncbi:MAG TPA: ABC transporter permease [Candidatus Limnocylindrales bacterium]|nr:ABC transporter permease [Candidatus Limnocylindrales bacterium]